MTTEELSNKLDTLSNTKTVNYNEVLGEEISTLNSKIIFDDNTSMLFKVDIRSENLPEERKRFFNILKEYNDVEVSY